MRYMPVVAMVSCFVFSASSVEARRIERIYAGKIVLLSKRAPVRFRTNGAFASFVRRHRTNSLWPNDKRGWRLQFFAFFRKPLRDVEVKVRFYDITEGRQLVASDSIYHSSRGQRILSGSSLVLNRREFSPNRRYVMYLLNARNVILAKTSFQLRGKSANYSGRVVFTDAEK